MKFNLKAGLLVMLLAVPAFLFLFLLFFGENQFDLPYLFAVGSNKDGEIVLSERCENLPNSDFLIENANQANFLSDSVFLIYGGPGAEDSNSVKIVYDCLNDTGPSENQISELKRIENKIENKPRVKLLFLYGSVSQNEYFRNFYNLLETCYKNYYYQNGIILLIDNKNYFRGVYDPSVKSEVDRLVTEYQILLDIKNENK